MAEKRRSGIPRPVSKVVASIGGTDCKYSSVPTGTADDVSYKDSEAMKPGSSDISSNAHILTDGQNVQGRTQATASAKNSENFDVVLKRERNKSSLDVNKMRHRPMISSGKNCEGKFKTKQQLERDLRGAQENNVKLKQAMFRKEMKNINEKKQLKENEEVIKRLAMPEQGQSNIVSMEPVRRCDDQKYAQAPDLVKNLADLLRSSTVAGRRIIQDMTEVIEDCKRMTDNDMEHT